MEMFLIPLDKEWFVVTSYARAFKFVSAVCAATWRSQNVEFENAVKFVFVRHFWDVGQPCRFCLRFLVTNVVTFRVCDTYRLLSLKTLIFDTTLATLLQCLHHNRARHRASTSTR